MDAKAILAVSARNLQRAPVRSALTALGVIVGVAAVVATSSIGNGAKAKIEETLADPGSRTVFLMANAPTSRSGQLAPTGNARDRLTPQDYYALRYSVDGVAAVSPRIFLAGARASANGRSVEVMVEGQDVAGFLTIPRKVLEGTLFSELDVSQSASVCVVSESLESALYTNHAPGPRYLRLNEVTFMVIGVVDDVTGSDPTLPGTSDIHVYIPFTSLLRRLNSEAEMSMMIQAAQIEHVSRIQGEISDAMEQRRGGRKAVFHTASALDSIRSYSTSSLTVARLLAAVGAISLIVGGIGIMNIMLVGVKERTREIGIRMAVGTRCRHVLGQFIAEALTLSLFGGAVGIAAGSIMSWLITRLNGWPTAITFNSIITALLCSVAVGLLFGYHPARRAALLRPVDALSNSA